MDPILSFAIILTLMAAVVATFRLLVRAPRDVSPQDPPGVRTVAVFAGNDPEFFRDDRDDEPFVGLRLFKLFLEGLTARGMAIADRGFIQYAQRAVCAVEGQRFGVVLEWIEEQWVISVEWLPETAAQRRHLALSHQIFASRDSRALRRLLEAIDGWLKQDSRFSRVRWHRKERWLADDASGPADSPLTRAERAS